MQKRDQSHERHAVRQIVREAKKAGFLVSRVWDGGEMVRGKSPIMNEAEVIDAVFSVDESTIRFTRDESTLKQAAWVFIVLGNADDGSEVAADWGGPPEFDAAVTKVTDSYWQ